MILLIEWSRIRMKGLFSLNKKQNTTRTIITIISIFLLVLTMISLTGNKHKAIVIPQMSVLNEVYELYHIDKSKVIINSPKFKVVWNTTNVKIGERIKFKVTGLKETAKINTTGFSNVEIYGKTTFGSYPNAEFGSYSTDTVIPNWKTTNNKIETYVFITPQGESKIYQYNFTLIEIH